jgi:hypothetical protein
VKVKQFLAQDNIAGKTIAIITDDGSNLVKIPTDSTKPFKTDGGIYMWISHDTLNAECKILETTVEDFFSIRHPNISYWHKTDKCGWSKYHICLGFDDCSMCINAESEKELEQELCRAINKKFNLHLEPSNLGFLK